MGDTRTAAGELVPQRENQLQFLRFLAFLNIYITHAEVWLFSPYPASHCATAAVSFFFMLSGLVTGYSLYGKDIRLSMKTQGSYLLRKLRRVYPLYALTTLCAALFSPLLFQIARLDFASAADSMVQLLRNLLLIQSWFPEGYLSFNAVGWFLSTLMFLRLFDLLFCCLLNRFRKLSRHCPFFGLAIAGILFLITVYCYLTQELDMGYWQYIFPPARLGEYLAGILLGFFIRSVKPRLAPVKWLRIPATVLEAGAVLYWFFSLSSPGNYWRNAIVSWLLPNLLLIAVFALGMGWISRLFCCRPLVRLGDCAFECFLIHNLIVVPISVNSDVQEPLGKAIVFLSCLIFSVLLALYLNTAKRPAKPA